MVNERRKETGKNCSARLAMLKRELPKCVAQKQRICCWVRVHCSMFCQARFRCGRFWGCDNNNDYFQSIIRIKRTWLAIVLWDSNARHTSQAIPALILFWLSDSVLTRLNQASTCWKICLSSSLAPPSQVSYLSPSLFLIKPDYLLQYFFSWGDETVFRAGNRQFLIIEFHRRLRRC